MCSSLNIYTYHVVFRHIHLSDLKLSDSDPFIMLLSSGKFQSPGLFVNEIRELRLLEAPCPSLFLSLRMHLHVCNGQKIAVSLTTKLRRNIPISVNEINFFIPERCFLYFRYHPGLKITHNIVNVYRDVERFKHKSKISVTNILYPGISSYVSKFQRYGNKTECAIIALQSLNFFPTLPVFLNLFIQLLCK